MPAPQEADIFLVPLLNGDHTVGQVIEVEKTPEKSVLCLLSLKRLTPDDTSAPLNLSEMIALVLTRPDHFADGTWPIIGFEQLPQIEKVFKLAEAKSNGFENVAIHEPAIIEAFANACHGHYPWDAFPDPQFFDRLLVTKAARPPAARMKSQFPA
ncbi:hypothetical protein SAMN04488515_0912 [Cognatiyoonia koreensis]|uniref:Immunity protein 26 n=1 Tax=Cognatiyoonia koreensis TaxID=364200 RepID=A0A1I0NYR9_9RHOB|nr:hypothetical protein [Cognatiyoonia koreensis]SEW07131.1 hypothetical protein SAMN04488515_0912 [Cognatiyoonia koreensis]